MTKAFKYIFIATAAIMAACSSDPLGDDYESAAYDDPNCPGIYFLESGKTYEFEPGVQNTLNVTICRYNSDKALTLPLIVKQDKENYWQVPATAEFAAGQDVVNVELDFSKLPSGSNSSVTISVDPKYILKYKNTGKNYDFTATVELVKWEQMLDEKGEPLCGFWIDGVISSMFSVESLPLAVTKIEKAILPSGERRYRFLSPYAGLFENQVVRLDNNPDHVAYIGYPYSEPSNLVTPSNVVITIDPVEEQENSTKKPKAKVGMFTLGVDFGFGAFRSGTIIGNLSNASGSISDESSYPLGMVEDSICVERNNLEVLTITFVENSLFLDMPTEGIYPASKTTVFTTDPQLVTEICYSGEGDEDDDEEEDEEDPWTPIYKGTYYHATKVYEEVKKNTFEESETLAPVWSTIRNWKLSNEWTIYVKRKYSSKPSTSYKIQPWITEDGVLEFEWNDNDIVEIKKAETGYEDATNGFIMADGFAAKHAMHSFFDRSKKQFVFIFDWYGTGANPTSSKDDVTLGQTMDIFIPSAEQAKAMINARKRTAYPTSFPAEAKVLKANCKKSNLKLNL